MKQNTSTVTTNESNRVCKYCHSSTHSIEDCTVIICKYCKQQGHPFWRCNAKKSKDIDYYISKIGTKWSTIM